MPLASPGVKLNQLFICAFNRHTRGATSLIIHMPEWLQWYAFVMCIWSTVVFAHGTHALFFQKSFLIYLFVYVYYTQPCTQCLFLQPPAPLPPGGDMHTHGAPPTYDQGRYPGPTSPAMPAGSSLNGVASSDRLRPRMAEGPPVAHGQQYRTYAQPPAAQGMRGAYADMPAEPGPGMRAPQYPPPAYGEPQAVSFPHPPSPSPSPPHSVWK